MAYSNDPYVDEDGEALMDPDAQFEDDDLERNRSPSPIMDDYDEDKVGKPKKRLIKKAGKDATPSPVRSDGDNDLDDFIEDEEEEQVDFGKTRKNYGMGKEDFGKTGKSYGMGKEDFGKTGKSYGMGKEGSSSSKGVKKDNMKKRNREERENRGGKGKERDRSGDKEEMKELWDTIAGGDSEDDQEGMRTMDDDNFIDDTGVEPSNRYGSDNEGSAGNAPQAEEGEEYDEVDKLFKKGKKKKKKEKTPAELALVVEHFMAELEVIAEEDADLNRQSKPAINKLRKLPMLIEVLSKKHLQQEFLDHGVLTLLKNWLEPLPDGSLPNMNIRSAILNLLTDYPIDLEHPDRREQLKKSGLGKVIMFLSKSDEETTSNRKIAKELVDKWSRPIFNKSTRYEDMRNVDEERVPYRRTPAKKSAGSARGMEARDDDVDEFSKGPKSGQPASRLHASRPEATPLDFVVRPQSKIDPDEIRARAKQQVQDQRRMKMNKKLQQLKAPKKKMLQASKLSVEGRGMVKYL